MRFFCRRHTKPGAANPSGFCIVAHPEVVVEPLEHGRPVAPVEEKRVLLREWCAIPLFRQLDKDARSSGALRQAEPRDQFLVGDEQAHVGVTRSSGGRMERGMAVLFSLADRRAPSKSFRELQTFGSLQREE